MSKNRKILIIGGAGYIGSHVINLLGKEYSDQLIILDNLSSGRAEAVLFGKLVIGDIGDSRLLDKLFDTYNFETVIHFAGSIVVPESTSNPLKYYDNNSMKSLMLLQMCKKYQVNEFIFSSTAAVYGESNVGIFSEEMDARPVNPYGRSKYIFEQMLHDYAQSNDQFHYICLRYFNVAGANKNGKLGQSNPNSTHLIKVVAEAALGIRDSVTIYGQDFKTIDGTCIRDYIHVDDLAQAHLDCLNYLKENKTSNIFNCGNGKGYSVKEVIECMKYSCNVDFKVEIGSRRNGDSPIVMANPLKLKCLTGWRPKLIELSTIVTSAFEWETCLKRKNQPNL